MNIVRSGFGVRFDVAKLSQVERLSAEEIAIEQVLAPLTRRDCAGLHLYAGIGDESKASVFHVVFSEGHVGALRRIYNKLKNDEGLKLFLCDNRPFIDKNRVTLLNNLDFLGIFDENGVLEGGTKSLTCNMTLNYCDKMPRIILAPDSFKGSVSAQDAVRSFAAAARHYLNNIELVPMPACDGGEGTVQAFLSAFGGKTVQAEATDPLGGKITASYGIINDTTAIIEMASASGLGLVPAELRNPAVTSSYGTGELINHALNSGCKKIVCALGGTATNDGGMGICSALGVRFLNSRGEELTPCGNSLREICSIDTSGLSPLLKSAHITAMCDVSAYLTGIFGATMMFSAQKGATPIQMFDLECGMKNYRRVLKELCGKDLSTIASTGAAGGAGGALFAILGAELKAGITALLEAIDFDSMLCNASLVITGEGQLDTQTVMGCKAVMGITERCNALQVPALVIAGSAESGIEGQLNNAVVLTLRHSDMSLEYAIENAQALCFDAAARAFHLMKIGQDGFLAPKAVKQKPKTEIKDIKDEVAG